MPAEYETTTWAKGLPEKELYDIYTETIHTRFPAFGARPFEDARYDMVQAFHAYDSSSQIDQNLVDIIVSPESHERFCESVDEYVKKYGLQSWLDHEGSLVFATDHGQFTDVPVTAHTLNTTGFGDSKKNSQVVSEMISVLSLDIGEGPFDVVRKLQNISNVVQTVPRLDGKPTSQLIQYRERQNASGLTVLENIRDSLGTITVMSVIGRHNQASKNGNTLYIHEPNRKTLGQFAASHVKVIPLYIHCPTFQDGGEVTPANMDFVLFPPKQITDPENDTREITSLFREATQQIVGADYKNGVKIRSFRTQQARRTATNVGRRIAHDKKIGTEY